MTTSEFDGEVLRARHLQLIYANMTAIKRMMSIKAAIGIDTVHLQPTRSSSTFVETMMPNTAIQSKKNLKPRPAAAGDTDVAKKIVNYVGSARYCLTLNTDISADVSAFHMRPKAETATLLKRQATGWESQTESKVKKIIFDGCRECIKRCTKLDADGIDISITA